MKSVAFGIAECPQNAPCRDERRYAQMWGAGAKCDFACASDYNLPPSLREVSRQSRDGGSFCPPCTREGGAAKLRRKGCRVIIRCKRLHLLCLLCPNLPLTRLSEKGECAVRYYVSPDGTAQRKNGGQARSAAPDGFPQITKIFRPFGRKIL